MSNYDRQMSKEAEYLRHLKALERSAPPGRKTEYLQLILITEQKILALMREERSAQERETANMEVALQMLAARRKN